MIEAEHAVHFGAAEVERSGNVRHRVRRYMAELMLERMQERQQHATLARHHLHHPVNRRLDINGFSHNTLPFWQLGVR